MPVDEKPRRGPGDDLIALGLVDVANDDSLRLRTEVGRVKRCRTADGIGAFHRSVPAVEKTLLR